MRQTRQILRLRHKGVSIREIGCRMAVARSTLQETLKRAARAGLNWPLPEAMNDAALEQRLFAGAATQLGARRRPEPDWARLALELKRPGVTLTVLWDEYLLLAARGQRCHRRGGGAHQRSCHETVALHIGAFNGPSIASIIATGAEQTRTTPESIGPHANLRGPGYFH